MRRRYRLIAQLGSGGMGTVWKAEHLVLGSMVAVKLLHPSIALDAAARLRFEREARAAASLRSPHVVQVFDHGVDRETPYIVMELLEGETLGARLRRTGVLSSRQTARIVTGIARALHKAHGAGIIHRDLKPENVFLVRNDDEEVAKLLDFGIVKVTEGNLAAAEPVTRTGAILGTPHYMSPEQLRGQEVGPAADLWSLGIIVFECVCGKPVFSGDSLADVISAVVHAPIPVPSAVADVPAGFDAWFDKAVSRDPSLRPSSARQMAAAFRALVAAELADSSDSAAAEDAPEDGDDDEPEDPEARRSGGRAATEADEAAAHPPSDAGGTRETAAEAATAAALTSAKPASRRGAAWGAALALVFLGAGAALVIGLDRGATPAAGGSATPGLGVSAAPAQSRGPSSGASSEVEASQPPIATTPSAPTSGGARGVASSSARATTPDARSAAPRAPDTGSIRSPSGPAASASTAATSTSTSSARKNELFF